MAEFINSREYHGTLILNKNEVITAANVQYATYYEMMYGFDEAYMDTVLAPVAGKALEKLFKCLKKASYVGMVYSLISFLDDQIRGLRRAAIRDILFHGYSSLRHLGNNWPSSWEEAEIYFVFLECTKSGGDTVRYFQGNSNDPGNGYRVDRVKINGQWITL